MATDEEGFSTAEYADDALLFYPGKSTSAEVREKIDRGALPLEEFGVNELMYSLSRAIERNIQLFFTTAREFVGEEKAVEMAFHMGLNHAGKGYESFLTSRGLTSSPRSMALYQDLGHGIRGPRHATALFARYDDHQCIVERSGCIYFSETDPENIPCVRAFENGCIEGYKRVDPNLVSFEGPHMYDGSPVCRNTFTFRPAED